LAKDIAEGARQAGYPAERIYEADDKRQAVVYLEDVLKRHKQDEDGGAILLIKGSLGIGLVEVVRALI
jgi:UDP-N-acetylmuramoyl-tripeptide--D-alanyl-D-alanine ligase